MNEFPETNSTFAAFCGVIADTSHEKFFEGGLMTSFAWSAAAGIATNKADEKRALEDQTEISDAQRELFERRGNENQVMLQWALPQIPENSNFAPTPEMVVERITSTPSTELRPDQESLIKRTVEMTLLPGEDAEYAFALQREIELAQNVERYERIKRFEKELLAELRVAFAHAEANPLDLDPNGFVPTEQLQARMLAKVIDKGHLRIARLRSQCGRTFGTVQRAIGGDILLVGNVIQAADKVAADIYRNQEAATEAVSDTMS